jgi:hypothetical protein
MKKIILLLLISLMMAGCDKQNSDGTYEPSRYKVYAIDSCEYVGVCEGGQCDFLAHKGNCCFCKERRQKELEELVKQLKEE